MTSTEERALLASVGGVRHDDTVAGGRWHRHLVLVVVAGAVGVSAAVLPLLGVHRWWWAPVSAGVVAVLAVGGAEVRGWLEVERRRLLRRREDAVDRGAETARVLSAHHGLRRRLPASSTGGWRNERTAAHPDRPPIHRPTSVPNSANSPTA